MKIKCNGFLDGGKIPSDYTCDGRNVNPGFMISDYPSGCISLVLIVDDIDAPGRVFDHWILFNLPIISELREEETRGTAGKNNFGEEKYGGPCPPKGEHRYFFRFFALDTILSLKSGVSRAEVEEAMKGHILAQAEYLGKYSRKSNLL